MKQLILKIFIAGGLIISTAGLSQTTMEEEQLLLETGESSPNTNWQSHFSNNENDLDYIPDKGYGTGNGIYYIFLSASGATPTNSDYVSEYAGGGCIYSSVSNSGVKQYDIQLQLQNGHEIKGMRYYYNDRNGENTIAALYDIDLQRQFTSRIQISSQGASGYGISYKSPQNKLIVKNSTYRYGIRFLSDYGSSIQQFCGVRIVMDSTP